MTGHDIRRRYLRVRAQNLVAHLHVKPGWSIQAAIDDISMGGMFAKMSETLAVGTPLAFDLVRPGLKRPLRLSGAVANGRPGGLGIRFDASDRDAMERLGDLVKDLGGSTTPVTPEKADAPRAPSAPPRTFTPAPAAAMVNTVPASGVMPIISVPKPGAAPSQPPTPQAGAEKKPAMSPAAATPSASPFRTGLTVMAPLGSAPPAAHLTPTTALPPLPSLVGPPIATAAPPVSIPVAAPPAHTPSGAAMKAVSTGSMPNAMAPPSARAGNSGAFPAAPAASATPAAPPQAIGASTTPGDGDGKMQGQMRAMVMELGRVQELLQLRERELTDARAEIARAAVSRPMGDASEAAQRVVGRLEIEKKRLEAELNDLKGRLRHDLDVVQSEAEQAMAGLQRLLESLKRIR